MSLEFLNHLSQIPDHRRPQGRKWLLGPMVLATILAVLSGATSYRTFDAAHGEQQLAFWNGFHGERGFSPIHVYEAETERPVAFVLRPAKTPSGAEARTYVRRMIRRIRRHWPDTRILLRGDGHYARPELMDWCEAAGVDFLFGMPMNAALKRDPNRMAAPCDGRSSLQPARTKPLS